MSTTLAPVVEYRGETIRQILPDKWVTTDGHAHSTLAAHKRCIDRMHRQLDIEARMAAREAVAS